MEPKDELSIEETISWADVEKDVSAWTGNPVQDVALSEIQSARPFTGDLETWRRLQTSDHFYYMASKFGSCGEVHAYFSPDARSNVEAFDSYMRILSDFETRAAARMEARDVAMELRCLPPEKAFRFNSPATYTGFTAYSLDGFLRMLDSVPSESVDYHIERGDFVAWIRDVLLDEKLARQVRECKNHIELIEVVDLRRKELWARLK